MTKSDKPRIFISIQWLLFVSVTALLTVILSGVFYWFYMLTMQRVSQQIMQDLTQAAETVALNVNADELLALSQEGKPNALGSAWNEAGKSEDAHKKALEQFNGQATGFSDDPRYQKLLDWLDTVHKIEPRAWPFLWVNDDKTVEVIYVVDLWARYNPEKSTLFLHREEDTYPTHELTLSVDDQGNLDSYTDDWGVWYSAWMPIKDSNGRIVGGLGVDFEAGAVDEALRAIREVVWIVFILIYLAMFVAVFLISRTIIAPIKALTDAADEVGKGHYKQDFSALVGGKYIQNEVSVLAGVFTVMISKVNTEVTNLHLKVKELRVEIDQAKRKKEVDEIAGSEFFRDLQDKAKSSRRKWKPSKPDERPDEKQ